MVTKTVELQTVNLESLLKMLNEDTEILLVDGETPIARLSPVSSSEPFLTQRIAGLHAGTTWVSDDFDEPLLV
jgi:antitoxin (DNA-binding transcriptional repressor) of toxin-antitoxin stability system